MKINEDDMKINNDLQTPLLLHSDNEINQTEAKATLSLKDLYISSIQCTHVTNDSSAELKETLAALAGNMMEWYDFAVFGYFADIIGDVMFPPQEGTHFTYGN